MALVKLSLEKLYDGNFAARKEFYFNHKIRKKIQHPHYSMETA